MVNQRWEFVINIGAIVMLTAAVMEEVSNYSNSKHKGCWGASRKDMPKWREPQ